jgi:hypothetical protein
MRVSGTTIVLVLCGWVMVAASAAQAQSNSCVDCHFATPSAYASTGAREHLADWERSAHGRNRVGCQECHGGDASSYEPLLAHRSLMRSGNPASPVHRAALPVTCGRCHTGPYVQFQKSQHFAMLAGGDARVPTCTTCHDSAGSRLPSPRSLESECQHCHGPKGIAPRVERAAAARTLLEEVRDSRELLRATLPFIERIKSTSRQGELREAYRLAEVPLVEAGQSVHEFVFDNLKERLSTARKRIEALLVQLANP